MRIALVSCVKSKLSRPAPARELYTSMLFRGLRTIAERDADRWFILSAKYGLVEPWSVIEPYELTLNTMNKRQRFHWSNMVKAQLALELPAGADVVIYAGARYREELAPYLRLHGHQVEIPLEGLTFGRQLQYLARAGR